MSSLTNGSSSAVWWLTAIVVTISVILGGGAAQGRWSDAVVQIISLPLIVAVFVETSAQRPLVPDRLSLILLIGLVAVPSLQLVPLPPALWTALPGHQLVATSFATENLDPPWLPLSLDPQRTLRSVLSLIPAIAVFLATLRLDLAARRGLSLIYITLGFISVLVGLSQLAQGAAGSLFLFQAYERESVGLFANRNHYAAFLYSLMPFTAAWALSLLVDSRSRRFFSVAASALVFAALMLGLGVARSRAGILLAVLSGVGSLGLVLVNERRFARYGAAVIVGAWLIGVVLIIQYALFGLLERLDASVLNDYRFVISRITIAAGWAVQPFGSGFGSFAAIYQIFEPNTALLPVYANHAHNDWLELWLEGGWIAVLFLLAFLFWFGRASLRAWRAPLHNEHTLDRALAQAATITLSLLLLHSAVDYPLRTTTILTLFGWCCALLVKPMVLPAKPGSRSPSANPQRNTKPRLRTRSIFRRRQSKAWLR